MVASEEMTHFERKKGVGVRHFPEPDKTGIFRNRQATARRIVL